MAGSGINTVCRAMAHHLFVIFLGIFFLNEYVKLIVSEEDAIHIMSYLCSWRKVDVVETLPANIVSDSKAAEIPYG